jgi:hypothetical protein
LPADQSNTARDENPIRARVGRSMNVVEARLVPARLAAGFGPTGDHKGRPYERSDFFNFG